MTHKLIYLKDAVGNNYVGINIPNEDVQPHLEKQIPIIMVLSARIFLAKIMIIRKPRMPEELRF